MIRKWMMLGLVCVGLMAPVYAVAEEGPLSFPNREGSDASAHQHNEEGIMHYNKGHFEEALKHFRTSVKMDPHVGESHFNMAITLDKLGNHGRATRHFKKAKEFAQDRKEILQSQILKDHIGG
ncbi:tetratricopeptide repeat protein [Nitrospina gracilis]|uniref:tetratricopeptide repeat protein n=1 Tax=Nitrospina gracilis TaxID=35801 RepID=UPI001F368A2A|nr:tetratricopeptide repeat protein [Nitrospina gracilis]MCF8721359.1 Tfp pilus assembly protein PilF [Nitrospina gracilis Nb-211]